MIDNQSVQRIVDFHGHMCPGLALGIRAAQVAMTELGPRARGSELVAIVETDMCGVDAIQHVTGCTFGKGNLIHRDHGKNAYTFVRRSDGKAVRVSARPGGYTPTAPEAADAIARFRAGLVTAEERAQFEPLMAQVAQNILAEPIEKLYNVRDVEVDIPRPARLYASIDCESCSEPTMETRIRRLNGRQLCHPCFEEQAAGRTPVRQGPLGRDGARQQTSAHQGS